MCEVTADNFKDVFKDIENAINNARFLSVDTEFSALTVSSNTHSSLFDSPEDRYQKLRLLCAQIIPVQVGISAFSFNREENSYTSHTFTFYTVPRPIFKIDRNFVFQSSSIQFLCNYNFDFNKFVYKGISFMNRKEENEFKENLNTQSYMNNFGDNDIDSLVQTLIYDITKFFNESNGDNSLVLKNIQTNRLNFGVRYLLHKAIGRNFKNKIWCYETDDNFVVKKVTPEEYHSLINSCNLEENLIDDVLGFTKIFRLLSKSKKPIIGHNLLTDLMLLYNSCENPLPKSYMKFKKSINDLFPIIFDTKTLSFEIRKVIPENKRWSRNTLPQLYGYFKDGNGRHLAFNSPLIEIENPTDCDAFHNAGWDSYCTGYIFIRMAHILAAQKYLKTEHKIILSTELFGTVDHLKNCLNMIRCSVSYIRLDGDDPPSSRPACLIVESIKRKPIDISKVTGLLSNCGFVEIKPYGTKRVIVAVDNFSSARRILNQFKARDDLRVSTYSALRHSPLAKAVMWSGIVTSSAVVLWLAIKIKS